MGEIEINLEILNEICRICLLKSNNLSFLYKFEKIENKSLKLSSMVSELFNIECAENDGFPSQICSKCMLTLCQAYSLKMKCLDSENILRDKIGELQNFVDIKEIKKEIEEYPNNEVNNLNENQLVNIKSEDGLYLEPNLLEIQMTEENQIEDCLNLDIDKDKKIKSNTKTNKNNKSCIKCELCSENFNKLNVLDKHMESVHNHKYLCEECGTNFKTRISYRNHMSRAHINKTKFICEICGKSYGDSYEYKIHKSVHAGEVKYLCGICGLGTAHRSSYKQHMKVHTKVKPYKCEHCGKDFRFLSNITRHKRIHTGERPYKCKECEKAFTSSEDLKSHSIIHTGLKPFSCQVCAKSFNLKRNLKTHEKIHMRDKVNEKRKRN